LILPRLDRFQLNMLGYWAIENSTLGMLMLRVRTVLILWAIFSATFVAAQQSPAPKVDPAIAPSHQPGFPLWAYGHISPPKTPEDWSQMCLGDRPRDCDIPNGAPPDITGELMYLEGSEFAFTQSQISAPYGPADWFPQDHPAMPDVVAHGKEDIGMRSCAICHLPNGQGGTQNGPVAGLPVDYFLRQLEELASGARKGSDTHKANVLQMAATARKLTDEEAREIAEYYSSIPFKQWVRVIESDTVPKFTATRSGLFKEAEGNETEPLGNRLVELPENTYYTYNLRHPFSGVVAYVPLGSLARGKEIVETGGGVSVTCAACHGADLRGTPIAPPIAGRQPSYIGRQLYDFQQGNRNGLMAPLMLPTVQNLTPEDLIAISAYVASLPP